MEIQEEEQEGVKDMKYGCPANGCKNYREGDENTRKGCVHGSTFECACVTFGLSYLSGGRYAEIDGVRCGVQGCKNCPFADAGDGGYGEFCRYPINPSMMDRKDEEYWTDKSQEVPDDCPLRKNE